MSCHCYFGQECKLGAKNSHEEKDHITSDDLPMPVLKRSDDLTELLNDLPNDRSAFTENGDLAFSTTRSKCLNFFSLVCGGKDLGPKGSRTLALNTAGKYMSDILSEDKLTALRLVFYKRDCRGGQGEKRLFILMMKSLFHTEPALFFHVLEHVPFYGCWRDLRILCQELGNDTKVVAAVAKLFSDQLSRDMDTYKLYSQLMINGVDEKNVSISLAAKWVPSKDSPLAREISSQLLLPRSHWQVMLRKKYLSPLRAHLKVVERDMSAKNWSNIDYSTVPSVAMHRYKKSFRSHDLERFSKWLSSSQKKVHVKGLFPHDVVESYSKPDEEDPLLEAQWKEMLEKTPRGKYLPISDVSGSMSGQPMSVSIALGILLASRSTSFPNRVVSFDTDPVMSTLPGGSLCKNIQHMQSLPWGGSTDLDKTFRLILDQALQAKLDPDQMPEFVILFTDGQFDRQVENYSSTAYERIKKMYSDAWYVMPHLVFWNLRGDVKTQPVDMHEIGTSLVSGFSTAILSTILEGKRTTPLELMNKVLSSERYSRITLPS